MDKDTTNGKAHMSAQREAAPTSDEPVQTLTITWFPTQGGLIVKPSDGVSLPCALGLLKLAADFYDNIMKQGAQAAAQPRIQRPGIFQG